MIRVGVIGAGAWGINHVRVAAAERRCELVAVCDTDPKALARARDLAPTAALISDVDQLLCDERIAAVVIATPAPTHASIARTAFQRGKHVLVEKPAAMSVGDALALHTAARASGRVGMVGHLMVHHPAVVQLRELLRSGVLGKLHYIHSRRVNLGRLRSDENALWSFGPHDVSMIDFLVERSPSSVRAIGQSVLQAGVEDVVFLTLRYPTGEMAHVHLSWLDPRKERRLTLVCSQKMAEFDDVAGEKLRIFDKGYDRPPEFTEYAQYLTLRDGPIHIPHVAMDEPLRIQFRVFLDAINAGHPEPGSLTAAVRVTRILEAAQRSLSQDGLPVPLT